MGQPGLSFALNFYHLPIFFFIKKNISLLKHLLKMSGNILKRYDSYNIWLILLLYFTLFNYFLWICLIFSVTRSFQTFVSLNCHLNRGKQLFYVIRSFKMETFSCIISVASSRPSKFFLLNLIE